MLNLTMIPKPMRRTGLPSFQGKQRQDNRLLRFSADSGHSATPLDPLHFLALNQWHPITSQDAERIAALPKLNDEGKLQQTRGQLIHLLHLAPPGEDKSEIPHPKLLLLQTIRQIEERIKTLQALRAIHREHLNTLGVSVQDAETMIERLYQDDLVQRVQSENITWGTSQLGRNCKTDQIALNRIKTWPGNSKPIMLYGGGEQGKQVYGLHLLCQKMLGPHYEQHSPIRAFDIDPKLIETSQAIQRGERLLEAYWTPEYRFLKQWVTPDEIEMPALNTVDLESTNILGPTHKLRLHDTGHIQFAVGDIRQADFASYQTPIYLKADNLLYHLRPADIIAFLAKVKSLPKGSLFSLGEYSGDAAIAKLLNQSPSFHPLYAAGKQENCPASEGYLFEVRQGPNTP